MRYTLQTRHARHIFPALNIIACTLDEPKAIYISTPITNGVRMCSWRMALPVEILNDPEAYRVRMQEDVIAPNCAEGQAFAARVRKLTGKCVIDPSPFMVDGWSQADYISLWSSVIKQYALEVWFNDGWEYSNGCAQEYLVAIEAGIPTKDASGQPLPVARACDLLENVIPRLNDADISADVIRSVVSALKALSA